MMLFFACDDFRLTSSVHTANQIGTWIPLKRRDPHRNPLISVRILYSLTLGATTSYTFSDMHGPGVNLSENNTVITAVGMDSAMAYTDMPIPVGKPFAMKVLNSGIIVSNSHS